MTPRFLSLILIAAGPLAAAEISLSWGKGPAPNTTVGTPLGTIITADSTGTTLFDVSTKMIGFGPVSLNFDVPVAIGGPGRAEVAAQSSSALTYAETMKWAVTPGLKLRMGLGIVSPWVSFGVGAARLDRAGTLYSLGTVSGAQAANGWSLALSPAGGIDIRPVPILFFRGEVRSYTMKPAEALFSTSSLLQNVSWRNNVIFLVGIGARF